MKKMLLASLFVALLPLAGCGLSPRQKAALEEYQRAVLEIQERLDAYAVKAREVVEAVEEGKLPLEEGTALIAEIQANYKTDREKLSNVLASVKEIRAQEVPWYYYLGPIATAALAFLGGRVPGWRTERVLGAVVTGVERAGDLGVKESIRDEAELAGVGPELHRVVRKRG